MAAAPEKRSRVFSLLVEVALRLHLARLGKSDCGCLKLLLLLLLGFIFGGTLAPFFGSENIPIDGVFSAREFVERCKFDVLGKTNTGGLKPSWFSGFRLEPVLQRFVADDNRRSRGPTRFLFIAVVCPDLRSEVTGQYERAPHERHASGIVRQRFLAQDLWKSEVNNVALPPQAGDFDVGISRRKVFE